MKVLGFILLGIQLLAYASGNSNMGEQGFGYMLGYNAWGIVGIILLIRAYNKESKTPEPTENMESDSKEDKEN
jgi:hypothetical protein